MSSFLISGIAFACVVFTGGCTRDLMPTPNVYREATFDPFAGVPESRQSNVVEIFYATDRNPLEPRNTSEMAARYGTERSTSVAFGTAQVRIGPGDLTWEELARESRAESRSRQLSLRYLGAHELIRLPDWPWTTGRKTNPDLVVSEVEREVASGNAAIQRLITDRLGESESKDVTIYVHGFNVKFEHAAESTAEMWHMLGRPGAVVLYSWPAGSGGVFGYDHDRESSEFTVSHLKRFVELIAACDAVERIHLVAHSRGTDVMGSAVRELHIKHKARGARLADAIKLHNLIFFAADLDQEDEIQRIECEGVFDAVHRTTIYTGKGDTALQLAANMFKSKRRLGQLRPDAVEPHETLFLEESQDHLSIIYMPQKTGLIGHGYHLDNPAVSSDAILLMLRDVPPGADHGRPLVLDPSGIWLIPDGYPRPEGSQRSSGEEPSEPTSTPAGGEGTNPK